MAKRKVTMSEQLANETNNREDSSFSMNIYQNHPIVQPVNHFAIAEQALKRIKDNLKNNLRINQKSKQLVAHSQSIAQKIQW